MDGTSNAQASMSADYLRAFQEISALIATSLNLKQTLDTIVHVTTQLIGTQKASIAIRAPDSDYLVINPQMGHVGSDDEFVLQFRLHVDEGIGGLVMHTQKPYVVSDSACEPLFDYELAQKDGVRAWICAPLVSKGQSIGLLYALNDFPTQFSDEQVKLTTLLAHQAAIAIENARLFEETEQRLRESNALFHVAQGFVENRSLDQLLQLIVDEARRSLPCADKAIIHLASGDRLEPRALSSDVPQAQHSAGMRRGIGVAGRALQLRHTQYISDTAHDPTFIGSSSRIRSLVVAPLLIGADAIGTLSADSTAPHAFNASSRQLLTVLANQAAVAIDKARLLDETLSEKRRVEAILSNMADGVMMLDRVQRIVSVNPTLARMLNVNASDLLGIRLDDAPYPLDQIQKQVNLSRTDLTRTDVQTGEPPGKAFTLYASPLRDSADQLMGYVLVVHDVTRERELDQLKSDFIATVSHELRTPLFSIRGFARLLMDGKVSDAATRDEFLQIVYQQSEQLTQLVNDLLDISRLDAGHAIDLNIESVDVTPIVADVLAKLRALAVEKQLRMDAALPPTLPRVRADARRLNQVLVNLIGNAIKFTPEGGCICVCARALMGALEISVSDSGIGIPADALPHLFERFYQVDHSTTRTAGGSGLGLYISQRIVQSLGGSLRAESEFGKGSCFAFTLPIATGD